MSKPGKDQIRYDVITQEDPDTGDLLLPIPPRLLEELGWREGDDVDIGIDPDGKLILKKSNK